MNGHSAFKVESVYIKTFKITGNGALMAKCKTYRIKSAQIELKIVGEDPA